MNTFIPYRDFCQVARCLDDKRLFKQAVEAKQIIDILTTGKTKSGSDYPLSMKHHPIVFAWTGYVPTLKRYFDWMLFEIDIRKKWKTKLDFYDDETVGKLPHWLTDEVCEMYQAHLYRKDSIYYKNFSVDPTIPFNWELLKTDLSVKKADEV